MASPLGFEVGFNQKAIKGIEGKDSRNLRLGSFSPVPFVKQFRRLRVMQQDLTVSTRVDPAFNFPTKRIGSFEISGQSPFVSNDDDMPVSLANKKAGRMASQRRVIALDGWKSESGKHRAQDQTR